MLQRLNALIRSIRDAIAKSTTRLGPALAGTATNGARTAINGVTAMKGTLAFIGIAAGIAYVLYQHPPLQSVGRGEVGVRTNLLTGSVTEWQDGTLFVLPGVHDMRRFSLRDSTYRPAQMSSATGQAPLQSLEGLSLGVDLSVRYALDPTKLSAIAKNLPDNIGGEIVEPAVHGVIYKIFARYTAREIFSTKRADIQQAIETELGPKFAADGIVLRSVLMGKVNAEQMAREGALVTRHPLLIQKTLADKLSDKIQVIIAPPPSDGGFIVSTLLGGHKLLAGAGAQAAVQPIEKE